MLANNTCKIFILSKIYISQSATVAPCIALALAVLYFQKFEFRLAITENQLSLGLSEHMCQSIQE